MGSLLIAAGVLGALYFLNKKSETQSQPTTNSSDSYTVAPYVDPGYSNPDILELAVDPFLPVYVPADIASPALTQAAEQIQQSTTPRTASELGATYTVPPVSEINSVESLQDRAIQLAYSNDAAASLALITKFFDPTAYTPIYNNYIERYNLANAAIFAVKGGWPPTPAPTITSVTILTPTNIEGWGTWHFTLSNGKYFNSDGKSFVNYRIAERQKKMIDAETLAQSLGV